MGFKLETFIIVMLYIFIHYSYVCLFSYNFSKFLSLKMQYVSFLKMKICRNEEKSTKMVNNE